MELFERDGLRFSCPAGWTLEEESNDAGYMVLLQSPGSAFILITLDETMPELDHVLKETLDVLKADYPTLESESVVDTLGGQVTVGYDLDFFALDLPTICLARAFQTEQGSILILCQASEFDEEETRPIFKTFFQSIEVEEELPPID